MDTIKTNSQCWFQIFYSHAFGMPLAPCLCVPVCVSACVPLCMCVLWISWQTIPITGPITWVSRCLPKSSLQFMSPKWTQISTLLLGMCRCVCACVSVCLVCTSACLWHTYRYVRFAAQLAIISDKFSIVCTIRSNMKRNVSMMLISVADIY